MKKLLLGMLLLALYQPAGAETYKCKIGGKVLYTNQTPSASAKCESVFTRKLPVVEPAAAAEGAKNGKDEKKATDGKPQQKTQADKELEDKLKKSGADDAAKKAEEEQARKQVKAQNCKAAKLNVETLKMGRVARMNEKGEKYFLDEATIAQEVVQANNDVEKWCGD